MAERDEVHRRVPLTIPLANGPVAAWVDRVVAGAMAAIAAVCVVALLRVEPDARGHGTHEQWGMAACGWPIAYGIPCPTCGCTTAACQVVHGQVVAGFVTQPFGAVLAMVGVLLGLHGVWCLLRRRSFVDLLVRVPFWRFVGGAVLLLLLAWSYKWLTWPA